MAFGSAKWCEEEFIAVLGRTAVRESLRTWRMAPLALRFDTAFLPIATTYSTPGSASRNASNWGCAKPPSRRSRIARSGKKVVDQLHEPAQNRRIPTAPAAAVTLPAYRYCSASSLKLTKPITRR